MADENEGEWLTYDEAAGRLGIKADSVRRRAASRKWHRRQGNDGKARVLIPLAIIPDSTPDNTPDVTPDDPKPDPMILAKLTIVETRLADAQAALNDMRAERDRWRDQAEMLAKRSSVIDRVLEHLRWKR